MHPAAVARRGVLLTSDLTRLGGDARQLQRAAASGTVHRVRRGAYVETADWVAADDRAKHLLRLRAVDATRRSQPVFSHESAAALHGLPILGAWSQVAHLSSDSPGRSKNGIAYHLLRSATKIVMVDGLACTSLADTLIDLALASSFSSATVSLDYALRSTARAALAPDEWAIVDSPSAGTAAAEFTKTLHAMLDAASPARGYRKALRAIDFATHLADSPGESVSRCTIHLLGFPAPELQHPFFDYRGRIGWGDFWWEHIRLLGEFDGERKYTDPVFLAGRTPERAVIDEKWREDRIRATDAGVSRWGWAVAIHPHALYAKLTAAGLRTTSPRSPAR